MSEVEGKVTVVIPTRGERFLNQTIRSIFENASGDVQVVAVLDGAPPFEPIIHWPGLEILTLPMELGMRAAINAGVDLAEGQYIMKLDGHCLLGPGWDHELKQFCAVNEIHIPRRYSLDGETWAIEANSKVRDYHYLCYPDPFKGHDRGMHGVEWPERAAGRALIEVDDNMCFQGSLWFMHKAWFTDFLGGMDENAIYHGWAQEPTELSLKTWLGGGRVCVNKRTWYAHLRKGRKWGRGYHLDDKKVVAGHAYAADQWMDGKFTGRAHTLGWLIEKFSPVPTWPEDWRATYERDIARYRGGLGPAVAHLSPPQTA